MMEKFGLQEVSIRHVPFRLPSTDELREISAYERKEFVLLCHFLFLGTTVRDVKQME